MSFEEREKLMAFYDLVSGARMHALYLRPGGVAYDIPDGFTDYLHYYLVHLDRRLDEFDDLLSFNRI
jgi:NADH:ubiquinone oxidoreductase subunit D